MASEPAAANALVVVGTSAGGLEALRDLVAGLPPDLAPVCSSCCTCRARQEGRLESASRFQENAGAALRSAELVRRLVADLGGAGG